MTDSPLRRGDRERLKAGESTSSFPKRFQSAEDLSRHWMIPLAPCSITRPPTLRCIGDEQVAPIEGEYTVHR